MRLSVVNNPQTLINSVFAVLLLVIIFLLARIIQSKKINILPPQLSKPSRFKSFLIKRRAPLLITFFVLAFLILGTGGSVIALSLKTKSKGDTDYKNANYIQALSKYIQAKDLWFPEKISYKLRDRDLQAKISKANIMIKSGNNYQLGVNAFNNKNYSDAKKYLSQLVEKDPHFQEAQQKIQNIREITQITPTQTPTQIPKQTPNSIINTNSPLTTCTGPDGKQFKATEDACKKFNSAWAATNFSELNKDYISESGLTVNVISLDKSEDSGSYKYTISYILGNKTSDKEINEGSFTLLLDDGTVLNQYGFFNSLFPDKTINRSYTFQILKTKSAYAVSFVNNTNQNTQSSLKWRIRN